MTYYDISYTNDAGTDGVKTLADFETALQSAVWDWEVDGDEAKSKENLATIKNVMHIRDNLREHYAGMNQNKPGVTLTDYKRLQEISDLNNKYASQAYKWWDDEIEFNRKSLG